MQIFGSMQVDSRNPSKQYGAWNQAFLQMVMSRGCLTGQDVFRGVKEIYERFKSNPKFPSIKVDTSNVQVQDRRGMDCV